MAPQNRRSSRLGLRLRRFVLQSKTGELDGCRCNICRDNRLHPRNAAVKPIAARLALAASLFLSIYPGFCVGITDHGQSSGIFASKSKNHAAGHRDRVHGRFCGLAGLSCRCSRIATARTPRIPKTPWLPSGKREVCARTNCDGKSVNTSSWRFSSSRLQVEKIVSGNPQYANPQIAGYLLSGMQREFVQQHYVPTSLAACRRCKAAGPDRQRSRDRDLRQAGQ